MSDEKQPGFIAPTINGSTPFDPCTPNNSALLNWTAPDWAYQAANAIGQRIAAYVSEISGGRRAVEPGLIAADLIALHCNGRPQDFSKWRNAQIEDAASAYILIYTWIDRRTGKIPNIPALPFDAA